MPRNGIQNARGKALKNAIGGIGNFFAGRSVVDNGKNPNSAAYKMKQSIGKPNPMSPKNKAFTNKMTSNQKVYGIGVGP